MVEIAQKTVKNTYCFLNYVLEMISGMIDLLISLERKDAIFINSKSHIKHRKAVYKCNFKN